MTFKDMNDNDDNSNKSFLSLLTPLDKLTLIVGGVVVVCLILLCIIFK